MEGGRGPEFTITKQEETTEKGFSEKRAARILEGKQTDNAQISKRKPIALHSRQKINRAKLIAAHERNAHAMIALLKTLDTLAKGSLRQEEQLMLEIHAHQKIQEQLLNALVLESRGGLTEDALPKELQDLIK